MFSRYFGLDEKAYERATGIRYSPQLISRCTMHAPTFQRKIGESFVPPFESPASVVSYLVPYLCYEHRWQPSLEPYDIMDMTSYDMYFSQSDA